MAALGAIAGPVMNSETVSMACLTEGVVAAQNACGAIRRKSAASPLSVSP